MPKPLVNNRIIYQNINGLVSKHDNLLSQSVKEGDSPTFANLLLTGDGLIKGNLYVEGNTTILNTDVIEFQDNIVLINRLENGNGVTLNQSGLEIERGTLENYRMVYNELDDTFKIGLISNLQSVATRENTPLFNGVMTWNNSEKRLDSSNAITIDMSLTSTKNASSITDGSLVLSGGLAVQKDIRTPGQVYLVGSNHSTSSILFTHQTSHSLNIISPNDILLTPSSKIIIPSDKIFELGENSMVSESITKRLHITCRGNVDFTLDAGKRINIPNQIPITFSTLTEKIATDGFNNMVISGSENINLEPGLNKKVYIPLDIGLIFSNNNQQISANLNNDLSIAAGNNINLTPGPLLDVCIPTDNGIKFGNSGNQRISADSTDLFSIISTGDITILPGVNKTVNIPYLSFSNTSESIYASNGNLWINSRNSIIITNTNNSGSGSSGSLYTLGGIGVSKTIYSESNIIIDSNETESFVVRKNQGGQNIFKINSSNTGKINIYSGDGTPQNPSLELMSQSNTNTKSLISLKTMNDETNGYIIGRGYNTLYENRSLTINIPSHSSYSNIGEKPRFVITTNDCTTELFSIQTDTGNIFAKGLFGLSNTDSATNATTAAFVVSGGIGILKNLIANGSLETITDSVQALRIKNASNETIFNVDSINKNSILNTSLIINSTSETAIKLNESLLANTITNTFNNNFINLYTNTTDTTDSSNGSVVVTGGVSIHKKLRVEDTAYLKNGLDLSNKKITNVLNPTDPQDAATKSYVDLVKQGLYVKDSVEVATTTSGNLSSDFIVGSIIDNYTLQLNDRILIKNQESEIENGIYTVQVSGVPIRVNDLSNGAVASGIFTFVKRGSLNSSLGWICNSLSGSDTVGVHDLHFTQFTGLGQVEAGSGLSKNFNQININVDNSSLEINSDTLRIKNTAVGTGLTGGSGNVLQTTSDQSHVTRVGTINTGVWQGSTVQVSYGGTGRSQFTAGSILFGNGSNEINTDSKLYFDNVQTRLGLGTNQPQYDLHISNTNSSSLFLEADTSGTSPSSKPQIIMGYSSNVISYIGLTRNNNEYANNIYSNSLVISHDKTDSTSIIQFATQQQNRMTILANGNVGINTSNPSSKFHVSGSLTTTDQVNFTSTVNSSNVSNGSVILSGGIGIAKNTNIGGTLNIMDSTPSTSLTNAAAIITGGLSIQSEYNSNGIGNGGALTVAGGGSIDGDLYIGGSIQGGYLVLLATDEAVNSSSGSLVTFGGIAIQCLTNATDVSNGGSFLTLGGASIGQDLYIGGDNYFYGYTNYYDQTDNLLNFYDDTQFLRFSLDRNTITNNFSLSRYNTSGSFVEKTFDVDNLLGSITFNNSTQSYNSTSASLVLMGGISINVTQTATSVTNGGGLTVAGGASILKNMFVGGDTKILSTTNSNDISSGALVINGGAAIHKNVNVGGSFSVQDNAVFNSKIDLVGNALIDIIVNDSTSGNLWSYFGIINDSTSVSFCELDFFNCVNQNTSAGESYGLKLMVSINNTNCSVAHNYYGNSTFYNTNKIISYIHKDLSNKFHLFVKSPPNTTTNINVHGKIGNRFNIISEGFGTNPNGSTSNYNIAWTQVYATNRESNIAYTFGDVNVEGTNFTVTDNFPIIGKNNINTVSSRNLGVAFQRYQQSNDIGTGEIVSDNFVSFDSLPNQTSASSTQIKFSALANSSDNYYNGYWIKIASGNNIDQVRKITSYNGAQRVAQIDSPWTNQNPSTGDIVYFYNTQFISFYFDDSNKTFKLIYNSRDPVTKAITHYDYADLHINHMTLSDTTPSHNATSGSITTLGGISISNTTDADSVTYGGTFTTLGGASIGKKLYVSDNIALGNSHFTPNASLHVKQTTASLCLENNENSVSYINFVENASPQRFGIISDFANNQLSLTTSTNSDIPTTSIKAFTLNASGFMGINTTSTNIATPLAIKSNNLISTDNNTGYLGLIAGNTSAGNSTISSRIMLFGNNATGSNGNVDISCGTSGSIAFYTKSDTKRMQINDNGSVNIITTTSSRSTTEGSLVVGGGVGVSGSNNASSLTSGGALTVAGGASIMKDLFIGGNIYINGNLNASGSSTAPEITFSTTLNCILTGYENNKLLTFSQEAVLSFAVWVTPTVSSQNCQIEFTLPGRSNPFDRRSELMASATGYTDDDNVIPIFNIICVGIQNEARGILKFQSVSTAIHYFTIICRYTMS
jgi:hypothetical protein